MKVFSRTLDYPFYKNYHIENFELENYKAFSTSTKNYKVNYCIENCTTFENKSIKIKIYPKNFQYKVNVILNTILYTKIYGYITDSNNNFATNVEVFICKNGHSQYIDKYIPICSSITDNNGMFQAVIKNHSKLCDIKIKIENEL
ncbi:hypothetical protein SAMN02745163_02030 [Clostridium cavendishii DSM 21758]|uniref:Uncharacterized protein n=1 Tax=Clostridium cavendishii DSM 21758 TaxID=1121302 RepID=A0A1M6JH00_9CLOT|nr:hypothetical protein [Clostridium cavendishii]SHJ45999.1 hypothetical protein SAMN02745163_02030 [Clostridium cavendishii DSM 21758]